MRTKNMKPYAYGSLYKEDVQNGHSLPAIAGNLIDFDLAGPFVNTRPDTATDQITILKPGVYQITADVSVLIEDGQYVLFNINLCSNGTLPLMGSYFDCHNTSTVTGTSVQAYLNIGDQIGIFISDTYVPAGRRPRYNRATLTVHLLDF